MSEEAPVVPALPVTSDAAAAAPDVVAQVGVTMAQSFKDRRAKISAEIASLQADLDDAEEKTKDAIAAKGGELSALDLDEKAFAAWAEHDVATAWNAIRGFFAGLGKHGL